MVPFIAATLVLGTLIGFAASRASTLSGKIALALSLAPFVGFGLGIVFC